MFSHFSIHQEAFEDLARSQNMLPKLKGSTLRSVFLLKYKVEITHQILQQLEHWCIHYELYKDHPQVLNTPYLGMGNMFFTESHQNEVFDIFNIDRKAFSDDIEIIETIDTSRYVSSDPFNIMIVWVAHLISNSKLTQQMKHQGMVTLFKILHYKFFTSLVNRRFPHKANEGIMRATIESLSNKFEIVSLGTWKRVIESRAEDIVSERSIHINSIREFKDDKKILYVITDAQTRLRDRIHLITARFHEIKDEGKAISTYTAVTTVGGDKILKDTSGALSAMVSNISHNILSSQQFIDNEAIKLLCGLNKTNELKPYMLKSLIIRFTDVAVLQNKKGQLDDESLIEGHKVITGHRALITSIIQTTYRTCINNGVNMKNKQEIFRTTGNIFRSSQIQDESVLLIKRSVENFVKLFPGTSRANTQSALRTNFILYVILLTFKYY